MRIKQSAIQPSLEVAKVPHNYRILIIDDDEACAKLLMWTLEELGQMAEIAYNGLKGIELAKSFKPELILLDIGLQGMNGYETCQAIRKEPGLENVMIVAQSGWGEREHRDRSKKSGFDHHLVKPIDVEALKNIVRILDQAREEMGI